MTTPKEQLKDIVSPDISFSLVADELRKMKRKGIEQQAVQIALEELRKEATTELEEDRILEILDLVSGSCVPNQRIWDD